MAEVIVPPGPLIGIRSARKPGPDLAATPDLSVVVLASGDASPTTGSIPRLVATLDEAGAPFEILVAGELRAGDPRVRCLPAGSGSCFAESFRCAHEAARGEFLAVVLAGTAVPAAEWRALREAMDPFGSFSYLPGSPAADVAMIVRSRSFPKSLAMYGMIGLFLSDLSGPFMFRSNVFDKIGIEFDGPATLLEIVVKAKRAGCMVRQVPLPGVPAPGGRPTLIDAWRVRSRLGAREER